MVLQRFQRLEGGVYGSYIHHDGTVGVVVECKDPGLLAELKKLRAAADPAHGTDQPPAGRATCDRGPASRKACR